MNKKICKCGNDEFNATQICKIDVVVDSENFFLRSSKDTMEESCYDSDRPCGDYTCTKCGEMYENLNKLPVTKYIKLLTIKEKKALDLQTILDLDTDKFAEQVENKMIKEDVTLFDKTIIFDDGFNIQIRVCTGQNNAYADFVLYDADGCEIDAIVDESLIRKVEFKDNDNIYIIDIIPDEKEEIF